MTTKENAAPVVSPLSLVASDSNHSPAPFLWLKKPMVVFILLAVLSLPVRLFQLNSPLTGEHEFRQTQTALSVWEIRAHGFSLLHPKLPLFGPPWECPFEYPVFQLVAAGVDAIAPWRNLDISIRLTSLIFYYFSAWLLFLLAEKLFTGARVALFTAAIFLFSPYHIFWSRASMIEYAAAFFALGYLYWLIRWTSSPGRTRFFLCLLFGSLASLTKITTLVVPLFAGAAIGCACLLQVWRAKCKPREPKSAASGADSVLSDENRSTMPMANWLRLLLLGLLVAIPVLPGYFYTRYGDRIKEGTPYTAWLSSKHPYLKDWNYGTRAQRLSSFKWKVIVSRMQDTVVPTLVVPLVIGFCFLPFRIRAFQKLPRGNLLFGLAVALGPLLTVGVFFNLYWVHTYYFIAVAPFLAVCAGLGLCLIYDLLKSPLIKFLFVLLLIGLWLQSASPLLAAMVRGADPDVRVRYLEQVAKLIGKEEPVIVVSSQEWSPFAPYYLKRRAFMAMLIHKPVNIHPLVTNGYFKQHQFHWLLVEGNTPTMDAMVADLLSRWKTPRAVTVQAPDAHYLLYHLLD